MIRVAFDIGGTFTDFVLQDTSKGFAYFLKVPSTPSNPGDCLLYTSPSPRDVEESRMPSSA